jgi:hypothetical protein
MQSGTLSMGCVSASTHVSISTKTNATFKCVWRLSGATHAPLLPSLFLARPRPVTTVRGNVRFAPYDAVVGGTLILPVSIPAQSTAGIIASDPTAWRRPFRADSFSIFNRPRFLKVQVLYSPRSYHDLEDQGVKISKATVSSRFGNQKRTQNPHKCTLSCGIGKDFHI